MSYKHQKHEILFIIIVSIIIIITIIIIILKAIYSNLGTEKIDFEYFEKAQFLDFLYQREKPFNYLLL